jgi:hypothetical protein
LIQILNYEKKVKTVMVNNSTNINETNNCLSPQIIEHNLMTTYGIGNTDPGLAQTEIVAGLIQ